MREHDEIIKDIKTVLEEKVAPSVAAHNGAIGFIDFASDTGVATLKLSGSCSGCAMSKITLQRGVEQTLKHYVPEVKSIVGEDDEQAAEQGYDPYFPKDKEEFTREMFSVNARVTEGAAYYRALEEILRKTTDAVREQQWSIKDLEREVLGD